MRKIAWAAVALIAIGGFYYNVHSAERDVERTQSMTTKRPEGVPSNAIFRGGPDGGYFIVLQRNDLTLEDSQRLPAYWLEAYDSFSGQVDFKGTAIFVSDREVSPDGETVYYDPPPVSEILSTAYYNGGELEFDINGVKNAGRIIPINLDLSQQ